MVRDAVHYINPRAGVRLAVQGEIDPAWLTGLSLARARARPGTLRLLGVALHTDGDRDGGSGREGGGRPLAVQGVRHIFHPPATLERWPSADTGTRLVLITRGVDAAVIRSWLQAVAVAAG